MDEIGAFDSTGSPIQDLFSAHAADGSAEGGASDLDVQAFLELLQANGEQPTESEMQKQFDKNFQSMSYMFMKGIYNYAEDEIRRRQ